MNIDSNEKNILNTLKRVIQQPTLQLKKKKVNPIITNLNTIIRQIENSSENFINQYKRIQQYTGIFTEVKSPTVRFKKAEQMYYSENKNTQSLSSLKIKALDDLKIGYETIQNIRKELTNEEIKYNFLIKKEENVYVQTTIPFEKMSQLLNLAYDSANGILIIIRSSYSAFQSIGIDDANLIEIDTSSSLFSATWRYFTNRTLLPIEIKNMNKGHFWEAYKYLLSISPLGNDWIPPVDIINNVFADVVGGGGVGGAFNKGGDTLDTETNSLTIQNKSFDSNLTGKTVIVNQLQTLKKIFIKIRDEKINNFNLLQNYFTGTRSYSDETYEAARINAKNSIYQKLMNNLT